MTPYQVDLVQSSWAKVAPIAPTAASLFYGKLFDLDPELRPLFKSDLTDQGRKLMQMLALAVRGLSDLDLLVPAVEDLGRRHLGYGVRQKDYDTVGSALLWTLEQGLGEEFTPEVRTAWTQAYTLLAQTMQQAAAKDLVPAAEVG